MLLRECADTQQNRFIRSVDSTLVSSEAKVTIGREITHHSAV